MTNFTVLRYPDGVQLAYEPNKNYRYDSPYLERSITKLMSFNNKMLLASDSLINDGLSGLLMDERKPRVAGDLMKMYNGVGSL